MFFSGSIYNQNLILREDFNMPGTVRTTYHSTEFYKQPVTSLIRKCEPVQMVEFKPARNSYQDLVFGTKKPTT